MQKTIMSEDQWQDESAYEEYDEAEDFEGSSDDEFETDTILCPACGAEIYEDTPRCPVCGEYITAGTNAWSGRPVWWIVLGILGLLSFVAFYAL